MEQQQCQHLKSCKAMQNFRKAHGQDAGDVLWQKCQDCPLVSQRPEASPKTPGFMKKTIVK